MSQHPYSASVPASEQQDLQQKEGQRKSGSFEALQDMVQKHQSQHDDSDDDDNDEQPKDHVVHGKDSSSSTSTPLPPGPSILIQEPDQKSPTKTPATSAAADGQKKQPKIRRSVKFNAEEDDGSNFIKN
ncbi:hypothetical protein MBANPS3_006373 [Mucor bainieri]